MMKPNQKEVVGAFILLLFALSVAFGYNYLSPDGIKLFGKWETSEGVVTAGSKNHEMDASIEINNPETILGIIEKNERIVLDVRPVDIYEKGHLPKALSFPLVDFDQNIDRLFESITRASAILVYCSSAQCSDSHTFADRLLKLRYEDVKVFSGGFRQWQEMGYDIEKNEN